MIASRGALSAKERANPVPKNRRGAHVTCPIPAGDPPGAAA